MPRLDADPGEEPRPDEELSTGMEVEDELAEDLTSSPGEGMDVEDQLEGVFEMAGPEEDDDDDGGGMETEHETRSPKFWWAGLSQAVSPA